MLMNKYRARILSSSQVPILQDFSPLTNLGMSSNYLIFIDLPELVSDPESMKNDPLISDPLDSDDKENSRIKYDGNPLECSFLTLEKLKSNCKDDDGIINFENSQDSFDCNPLSLSEAVNLRNSIHNYGKLKIEKLEEDLRSHPCWVAVHNNSFPSISLLSCGVAKNQQNFVGITRSLGKFLPHKQLVLNQLNGTFDRKQTCQTRKFRSLYNMLSSSASSLFVKPGTLSVEINWSGGEGVGVLSEPVCESNCTIRIDPGWLDERFVGFDATFRQLDLILKMALVLNKPERELVWPAVEAVQSGKNVEDMLLEVIEFCSSRENVAYDSSRALDVTEQVWNVLARCESLEQSTRLLNIFMNALRHGRIRATVHGDNKSRLARLVQASLIGDFSQPRLERLNTIEMIMEIGVESRRRNLIAKFLTSQFLFSEAEVETALKECEVNCKDMSEPEARAFALIPLTLAYIAVSHIERLLNDDARRNLIDLTRKIIAQYVNLFSRRGEDSHKYLFQTTLPLSRFNLQHLKKRQPEVWSSETTVHQGRSLVARMLTSLTLGQTFPYLQEQSLAELESFKADSMLESSSEYNVSHSTFTFHVEKP
ncbi:unnamed protein product [Caenorhabditis auriculariae]|uniref:Protein zwilch n=1 Tax=Caenorhabditis auriculariae TaxID=2777116 RepID=A0A8S1I092_9PELO|nr:unnamed protein product [Caenorhabditis auriculariae]